MVVWVCLLSTNHNNRMIVNVQFTIDFNGSSLKLR